MVDSLWQYSLTNLHALGWLIPLLVLFWVAIKRISLGSLIAVTVVVTLFLLPLGAYVRLTDSGLGCPDWPGCYGKLTPYHAGVEILEAEEQFPSGPVSVGKAWKEMLHRYLASAVGMLILAIFVKYLIIRRTISDSISLQKMVLPSWLVVLVILQGLLGKWTVTMLLNPVIVTLHLLGGMLLLAMLAWLASRHLPIPVVRSASTSGIRLFSITALIVLFFQIAIGGWVSTNYAALACPDFPTCQGTYSPNVDFFEGFIIDGDMFFTGNYEPLSLEALTAIHWMHRIGALFTACYLGILCVCLWSMPGLNRIAQFILLVLIIQIVLGVVNVVGSLPLPVAVAHNGIAGLLLVSIVVLNCSLLKERWN